MAFYDKLFSALGLSEWCGGSDDKAPLSLADLAAQAGEGEASAPFFPIPSFDNLHESCNRIWQSRDVTNGIEDGFLAAKPALKTVLDPITQPLSWVLDGALWLFEATPWFIMVPVLVAISWYASRSRPVTLFVAVSIMLLALVDHYDVAMQTLSIIFVCTTISVLFGVPIGIAMSKSDRLQKSVVPLLDLLQTLPTFVYLIPLIFLFSVTESKLYGIAIILYAIVPVIRLTDLGHPARRSGRDRGGQCLWYDGSPETVAGPIAVGVAQYHGRDQPDHHDEPCHGRNRLTGVGARSGRERIARHPEP